MLFGNMLIAGLEASSEMAQNQIQMNELAPEQRDVARAIIATNCQTQNLTLTEETAVA